MQQNVNAPAVSWVHVCQTVLPLNAKSTHGVQREEEKREEGWPQLLKQGALFTAFRDKTLHLFNQVNKPSEFCGKHKPKA